MSASVAEDDISLVHYAVEKSLILTVPDQMLLGEDEHAPVAVTPEFPVIRPRRPRDCPFDRIGDVVSGNATIVHNSTLRVMAANP